MTHFLLAAAGQPSAGGSFIMNIAPLLIITQLEQYDYAGATAIATVMLVASFAALLLINLVQAWSRRRVNG